jgi:hypothetical protein
VEKRRGSDNEKVILCHVHWFQESACGVSNELFLKHRDCQNIRLDTITSVEPINIGTQGPNPGRPLLRSVRSLFPRFKLIGRHVFHHAYNVWRDPRMVDDKARPLCDSCCSLKQNPKDEYHLFDSILVEEKIINPKSTSLVWRVGRIIRVGSTSLEIQLFDRYSDWSKGKKAEYVSEVSLLHDPLYMTATDQAESSATEPCPPTYLPLRRPGPRTSHSRPCTPW